MSDDERVIVRAAADGDVAWLGGFAHATKLSGAETGGAMCVVECDAPRDAATPWHVHHRDDETFYVLEGEMIFYTGAESTTASPGTLVHLRRGIPHAFVVESERARFLVLGTPAIQDAFFHAAGAPTADEEPADFARLAQIAGEHGVELLGPPPTHADPEQHEAQEQAGASA